MLPHFMYGHVAKTTTCRSLWHHFHYKDGILHQLLIRKTTKKSITILVHFFKQFLKLTPGMELWVFSLPNAFNSNYFIG